MTPSSNPIEEVTSLLNSLCEHTLSEKEASRLEKLIVSDPAVCDFYLQYIDLHADLRRLHHDHEPNAKPPSDTIDPPMPSPPSEDTPPQSSTLGFLGNLGQQFGQFLPRTYPSLLIPLLLASVINLGLVFLMAIWVIPVWSQIQRSSASEIPPAVAQLTGTINAVWGAGSERNATGNYLIQGQELRLISGLVEVTFHSGARVVLEGPSTFRLDGKNALSMSRGVLTAKVPDEAYGFTVQAPRLNVVDLGTEFGLVSEPSGAGEVHVFQGAVQVRGSHDGKLSDAPNEEPLTLNKGQAVRLEPAVGSGFLRIRLKEAVSGEGLDRWEIGGQHGKTTQDSMMQPCEYVKAGPVGGTTLINLKGNLLSVSPTTPGHALVYDTGFTTVRSSYRIVRKQRCVLLPSKSKGDIRTGIVGYSVPGKGALGAWIGGRGDRLTYGAFHDRNNAEGGGSRIDEWQASHEGFFLAQNQASGDGVSNLDPEGAIEITMAIHDTDNDDTSTFHYTFRQKENTWEAEVTFSQLRELAEKDAPGEGGRFVDTLIASARSGMAQTGFAYYSFVGPNKNEKKPRFEWIGQ